MYSSTRGSVALKLSEPPLKLGSREDAEALIEFALESSKGYDAIRDAKLMKIATDNDAVDHYKKMKSYYEVEQEAVEGKRGYRAYERELKHLIEAPVVNKSATNAKIKQIQNFLATQENDYNAMVNGIQEAELQAKKANEQGFNAGNRPKQVKVSAKNAKKTFEFAINFDNVNGSWVVAKTALNMRDTKKQNVDGLLEALKSADQYIKQNGLGIDTGVSSGVDIMAGITDEKAIEARKRDNNLFTKMGVTSVIHDNDSRWAGKGYYAIGPAAFA